MSKITITGEYSDKEHILITGGAGFIGSMLAPMLLEQGYKVTCFDNLMYDNGPTLLGCYRYDNFKFVNGDIRNVSAWYPLVKECDIVIHLAAIVGYPACKKNPDLAVAINYEAAKSIANAARKEGKFIMYASTGSNYGKVPEGEICTEETPLNPLTIYGKTKTNAESYILNTCVDSMGYRFATAFGIAPRARLDLLINDFTFQAVTNNFLILYEKHFRRTFIHVVDIAHAFLFAIEHIPQMRGNIYNCGANSMNATKESVALKLKEVLPKYYLHFADVGTDADQRDYAVSYDKLNALGFNITRTLDDGIMELIEVFKNKLVTVESTYKNV